MRPRGRVPPSYKHHVISPVVRPLLQQAWCSVEQIGPLAREWVIQDLSHVQWWMSMASSLQEARRGVILLMEGILHQLIWRISHFS